MNHSSTTSAGSNPRSEGEASGNTTGLRQHRADHRIQDQLENVDLAAAARIGITTGMTNAATTLRATMGIRSTDANGHHVQDNTEQRPRNQLRNGGLPGMREGGKTA